MLASCKFLNGCVIEKDYFFLSTRLDAQPSADFDHGRLSWYDGGKWNRRDRNWQVESVCVLRATKSEPRRAYCALEAGSGEVAMYWPGEDASNETLPGAEDGHGLHTMMQIRQIGESLFAVGSQNKIFKRTKAGWQPFDTGAHSVDVEEYKKQGMSLVDAVIAFTKNANNFNTIDGTTEENLFGAGIGGIIFHSDGTAWTQVESPTNANLNRIKCVDENTVYIAGDHGILLVGSAKGFRDISTNVNDDFRCLEWFNGKLYVGGDDGIYELDGGILHRVNTGQKSGYPCVSLDAYDGQLLALSERWFLVFDGKDWKRYDDPDNEDVIKQQP
jgi:hypothetical protein